MLNTAQSTQILSYQQQASPGIELGENAMAVLKRRYLRKGLDGQPMETVEQMFRRVASHVAAVESEWEGSPAEAEAIFYNLLTRLRFMPNSPTFTGAGTPLGQLAACFVLPVADDMGRDQDGIFQTLRNAALIQQTGGGTGFSFSRLRPKGAIVHSSGGQATGPVGFMRVYDTASEIVSQGGCLVPETLVFTENGLLRLDELVNADQPGWQSLDVRVATDEGTRPSPRGYNHGVVPVLSVRTNEGLAITGTHNHRVKVMTDKGLEWRRLDHLQPGDYISLKLGQHRGQYQTLCVPNLEHWNQIEPSLPLEVDEELAFFLGYLTGDGFVASGDIDYRVGVSVAHTSYLMEEMPALMERLFGLKVYAQSKPGDASTTFVLDNRAVKDFLVLNDLAKSSSLAARVPRLVRMSPPEIVGAYLRGLFEADGALSHGYPELVTASEQLAEEVAVLLIGLGCPVTIRFQELGQNHWGDNPIFRVRIHSYVGLKAWREYIGCDSGSRFGASFEWEPDLTREHSYPLPQPSYWVEPVLEAITLPQMDQRGRGLERKFRSTEPGLRRRLLRYLRGDRRLTRSGYRLLAQTYPDFACHASPVDDRWFVMVEAVEPAGEKLTLDLEVDDNHTYLANGFVTHNSRRGANMAVLRVDHPDIREFIDCKRNEHAITNFNISVGVTDAFMQAVEADDTLDLVNPRDGKVLKAVRARELFDEIVAGAYRNGEPGMLFLDTANRENPCPHLGEYEASNPCGEQFLLPYENCCLGSVNLAQHVSYGSGGNGSGRDRGRDNPSIDWEKLRETVEQATRFLDDVISANGYVPAIPQLEAAAHRTRRIGLGIMGFGDLLYGLNVRYGSDEAQELAAQVLEFIRYHAMRASVKLAQERGPFPAIKGSVYDPDDVRWTPPQPLAPYTRLDKWGRPRLDWAAVVGSIQRHGIRNAAQTTVAPTGTVATVSGCEAYGCEPVFALAYVRHVNDNGRDMELRYTSPLFLQALEEAGLDEAARERVIEQVALAGSCQGVEEIPVYIRETFVVAGDITAEEHVRMQAAFQAFVDASISKCVAGDTLLFTERGILPIGDLYQSEPPDTFRALNDPLRVADWGAPVAAQEFYFGGERETICLMTDLGLCLEATPNHRVRVLEARGNIVWRRMDELREEDYLVVPYDYPEALGRRYEFSQVYGTTYQAAERTVAKVFSWPYKITRDLARLLGYLTADGYIGQNWVQLSQSDDQVVEDARRIFRCCFGAEAKHKMDERREHLNVLQVNGRDLVRFFRDYLGMDGLAPEKHIPRCVTASGPWIARDYVRGLTLDGYVSHQGHVVPLTTMSERLARETQALLLALGVPARISQREVNYAYKDGREGATSYTLTVLPEFRERFLEIIGFAEERKNKAARDRLPPPRQRRGNQVPRVVDLCVALIKAKLPHARSRRAEDYLRSTLSDLRQPDKQTLATDRIGYILDLCADQADTDEYRQLARVTERKVVYTPVKSLSRGRASVYDLYVPETSSFISNGLVSHNTINCPADATPDDVARAFRLAWELGCKGLTVYVTGSREKVVLETEVTRQARQGSPQAPPKTVRRPRPHRLEGMTYRLGTPLGTAYITINANGGDEPFEVFLNVGKAGSDTAAVAEAIGRLISLVLRIPSPLSATRRLRQVVAQLKGIGGGRPLGFGRERVMSLPDGVAQVLAEHLGMIEPQDESQEGGQLPLFPTGDLCPECGHAALVKEEGCSRCYSCGHSEC